MTMFIKLITIAIKTIIVEIPITPIANGGDMQDSINKQALASTRVPPSLRVPSSAS